MTPYHRMFISSSLAVKLDILICSFEAHSGHEAGPAFIMDALRAFGDEKRDFQP